MNEKKFKFVKNGKPTLKQLREALKCSQEEFARRIGVSLRTATRWEKGDSVPTFTIPQMKNLMREIEKLGLSVYDLPDDFSSPPSNH